MSGDTESAEAPTGVQVVRLGAGEGERRYELDEAALRRLLLRPDVRDLPVVVLSVAGAYRNGKSFILDFFLRYLNAPRSSQLNGEWLGNDDERLIGFHWRGGSDRDTTGIHLWPEPFITTLGATNQKVAVLLMDTQGTFDSESTIGQNSTIFALSTLMSSVQIYNLSGNIKEDDLQHLQLFTEYGKLVSEAQGKAFQALTFLVRDFQSPYEHAYGYDGGAALLRKRLQFNPNQKAELRAVREHIDTSFQEIKCFLMPHPGLNVAKQTFTGCIRDLTEEFRLALLELVPSLFDPKHLTPKLINEDPVRTQDLFEFFQKYVDIFNSDEVPEAVTIFKATADACLLAAQRAARSLYAARMGERTRGARSVPASTLTAAHQAARAEAELCYKHKKKLGSNQDADARFEGLIKELDGSLSPYILNNESKVRETMILAKSSYVAVVSRVCEEHARLCLHPQELEDLNAEASMAALSMFDAARDVPQGDEDDRRPELEQSLKEKYESLCVINERNNKSAVLAARDVYVMRMKNGMQAEGVSSKRLRDLHQGALVEAEEFFTDQRNKPTPLVCDPFVDELLQEVDRCFVELEKSNKNNKKVALEAAEHRYNEYVTSAWVPPAYCFHPRALVDFHELGVEETLAHCLAHRDGDEQYREEVTKSLEKRYAELIKINEYNNERAVEQAVWVYIMESGGRTRPASWRFLERLFHDDSHEKHKSVAAQDFMKRRLGAEYPEDEYYNKVIKTVDARYYRS